jgi:hypothetical protein
MGDALGFSYVDLSKRLSLAHHSYRLCLVVGVQPKRAAAILADVDGGLPQRFLWLPATDPQAPDYPPAEPVPWTGWQLPRWYANDSNNRVVLPVCDPARIVIDAARVAGLRRRSDSPDDEALDSHAPLCRLKVAAVLGILDGRAGVSDDDWTLAGAITGVSEHTRRGVVETLQQTQRDANAARGRAEGERSVIAAETVAKTAVRRIVPLILRKLAGPDYGVSHSVLRRAFSSRDRGYFDAAIDLLIEAGQVIASTTLSYDDSEDHRMYKLAGGHRD